MDKLSAEEIRRSIFSGVEALVDEVKEVREHNIMFYGFGDLAEKSLNSIATSHRYFRGKLKEIYLVGRGYEDEGKRGMLLEKFRHNLGELDPQSPEIIVRPIEYDKTSSYLDNIDIFILTAGISKKGISEEGVNRKEMTGDNLSLVDEIGPLFERFQGHVHIVTNQPEILCYKLASETDLDPHQISGHSHIDKKRLDSKISEYFENVDIITEAFCVGYHGCVWPVLNKLRVNSGNGFKGVNQETEFRLQSEMEDIKTFLEKYGDEQVISSRGGGYTEKRATSYQAGDAIRDFILTYIFPGRIGVINASVFLDHIYSAAPTYLIEGRARPNISLWNRRNERDIEEYNKRKGGYNKGGIKIEGLEEILDSFELRGGSRLNDIENKWEGEDSAMFKTYKLPQEVPVVGSEGDEINKKGLGNNVGDSGIEVSESITKSGIISAQNIKIGTVIIYPQGKEVGEFKESRVVNKGIERREGEKTEEAVASWQKIQNADSYLILPGRKHGTYEYPDLLVSTIRSHNGETWNQAYESLEQEDSFMLTLRQYVDFLNLLRLGDAYDGKGKKVDKSVLDRILDDILTVRGPWRGEWLDAKFSSQGKLKKTRHITYHDYKGNKVNEPLEDCLRSDKTPGIDVFYWLSNATSQGLPPENNSDGSLYYWYPGNEAVARFSADLGGVDLDCDGGPRDPGSGLGVRAAKIFESIPKERDYEEMEGVEKRFKEMDEESEKKEMEEVEKRFKEMDEESEKKEMEEVEKRFKEIEEKR